MNSSLFWREIHCSNLFGHSAMLAPAGFRVWLEVLLDGMSREQIVEFLESGEFQAKFGQI